jgi:hypothetical protein
MTEEDFLKRWTRRKRAVAEAEKPASIVVPEEDAVSTVPAEVTPVTGADAPVFDPASLPPIESITAVSDVTAFLRAGVPAELTRAALRRVWTADPAIRDFVGLAENAWDFTDPNAMPGFGPLESTDEVRRMIAQVIDQIGKVAQPEVSETEQAEDKFEQNSNDSNVLSPTDAEPAAAGQIASRSDQVAEKAAEILGNQVLLHSNEEYIAPQHDVAEATEKPQQLLPRAHGGALPR